jgi:hypothetical protein
MQSSYDFVFIFMHELFSHEIFLDFWIWRTGEFQPRGTQNFLVRAFPNKKFDFLLSG